MTYTPDEGKLLNIVADRHRVPVTTLCQMWVREKLHKEIGDSVMIDTIFKTKSICLADIVRKADWVRMDSDDCLSYVLDLGHCLILKQRQRNTLNLHYRNL